MFRTNIFIYCNDIKRKKLWAFVILLLATKLQIFSQDIHFSQLSQSQLFSNPAFTGISYGPKVLLQYRNQYPRIGSEVNSGYNSLMASYDQFIPTINSGFGLQILGDKYGENVVSRYHINALYAYQIKLSRYHAIRIGLGANYNIQQLDYSNLRFYDQIDPINGFGANLPTQEVLDNSFSNSFLNMDIGGLYFRNNFYIGFSAKNLLPKKNFFNNSENTRFYSTLLSGQIGGILRMGKNSEYAVFPFALYERQYGYQKIVANLIGQYKMVNIGLGARHNVSELESIILLMGCNFKNLRFSYSYDIVTSALSTYSGGSHEIGVRILFGGEDNSLSPNAEKEILYCPDFLKN